jgi:hypothetical protein
MDSGEYIDAATLVTLFFLFQDKVSQYSPQVLQRLTLMFQNLKTLHPTLRSIQ